MSRDFALVKLAENGRLSVPSQYRKLLGIEHGGMLVARVEDGELRIAPVRKVIAALQDEVSKYKGDSGSGVDWLLAERRREVEREEADDGGSGLDEHSRRERDHRLARSGGGARGGR